MNKKEVLKNKIEAVIRFAKHELEMINVCVITEASTEQLSGMIIPEMKSLLDALKNNQITENRVIHSYNYASNIWKWSREHPSDLYLALIDLNDYYQRYEI